MSQNTPKWLPAEKDKLSNFFKKLPIRVIPKTYIK